MIEKGWVMVSEDGTKWKDQETFEFGNLINDPTKRTVRFTSPIMTRFIRIVSERGAGGSNIAPISVLDFFE